MSHQCPKCGKVWDCLNPEDCDNPNESMTCPLCFAEENDFNPDTHIGYPGAFAEWKKIFDLTKEFKQRPDRLFWIKHNRRCTSKFLRRYRDADVDHYVQFTQSLDISSRTASKIARGN